MASGGVSLSSFDKRLAFAYTVVPAAKSRSKLPPTLGCIYINPATRRGYDAEVLLWAVSHGRNATEAKTLDAELEALTRAWLREAWPFKKVAFPGRGDTPWASFEELPFRNESVPRIGADAKTVFMYDAKACGLARV